jgi:signal transduction histidine kinase
VISDGLIALSYYSIPLSLWAFLSKRRDIPYPGLLGLFAVFIFACGTTHIMSVVDIWQPLYWLDSGLKALTAAVSLVTAIALWILMPQLLNHPSRAELEATNERLRKEIETRTRLEREMHELNHTLEYRVRQRTDQLQRLNNELRLESTERRRAEEQTRSLNLNLEQRVTERTMQLRLANQELEAFSYSVAHDLWAPLRAIDGFSQALLEDFGDQIPEGGKRFLGRICAASERMGMLIDSMLELSRLTRSDISRKYVDLSAMAHSVVETLAADRPNPGTTVDIQGDLSTEADPKFMRIVLENLIGNAWKYTSKNPEAHIEFGRLPESAQPEATWFVRDNGVGFDMRYAEKLFGVFQRLHTEAEFPGNGVGLATVRRILAKHGGRIWADAQVGRGATFFFTVGGGEATSSIESHPSTPLEEAPNVQSQ